MPVIVTIALLAARLFQATLPQQTHDPKNAEPATQPAATRQKKLSVNWETSFPFAGCDNGKPVSNVEIPEANGPTPMCTGVQSPDVLPQRAPTTISGAQDETYEVGTVIALGVSQAKVVIAADSRYVLFTGKKQPDGTPETKYDDCACKLTQLTPTILFAADGLVQASNNATPAAVLYDAHKLAQLAAQNYHPNPNSEEEQLAGGMIEAIATRWAWDVDFRMHHGFASSWRPIKTPEGITETLEGIFVGLEANGEIAMVVAKLEYPKPRKGVRVPPVSFSISRPNPPPSNFTLVDAFGMKDVAETFYLARYATEQTKVENKRINSEASKDPILFSDNIPKELVDLTIQHYKAIVGPTGQLYVHEPIDLAVLERKKQIRWIHWKKCSGATND
jgi:hypothetical protein